MRTQNCFAILISLPAIVLAATACGPMSFSGQVQKGSSSSSMVLNDDGTYSSSDTANSDDPTSTDPGSSAATGNPLLTYRAAAIGYNSYTISVSTNRILKVKFTPGIQDQTTSSTSEMPQYSKLGVYITVNGNAQQTGMLYNGYGGSTAQTSAVMDFSNSFTHTCSSTSTTCRQHVTITVDHPNNDYYCLNLGYYCSWTHAPDNYPWHGTLTVQTDDTQALTN